MYVFTYVCSAGVFTYMNTYMYMYVCMYIYLTGKSCPGARLFRSFALRLFLWPKPKFLDSYEIHGAKCMGQPRLKLRKPVFFRVPPTNT